MTIIYYNGRAAGVSDGDLVALCPRIDALEPDHPRRRFVSMMALYAMEIAEGHYPGPYRTSDAHDFARCMLMGGTGFLALAGLADHELAERFAVPLDQVTIHRQGVLLR